MKPHTPSGYGTVLKNGTIRSAFGGSVDVEPLCIHAMSSCTNCALSGAETENAR